VLAAAVDLPAHAEHAAKAAIAHDIGRLGHDGDSQPRELMRSKLQDEGTLRQCAMALRFPVLLGANRPGNIRGMPLDALAVQRRVPDHQPAILNRVV
jgi:hypothetical protein